MKRQGEAFFCVKLWVESPPDAGGEEEESQQDAADRIGAECWGAGAAGLEERAQSGGILLLIYVLHSALQDVLRAAAAAGARVAGKPEPVADLDWSEDWKQGLEAIEVSPRLVVRPSFVDCEPVAGRREIVIDPGQAFGTGGHASTRLILEWLDVLSPELKPSTRVLDVGTGTGVLALAALALGAGRAVAFDLDPLAASEASFWARGNGYADRTLVFAGGIEALRAPPFDLVLANLLRSELLPLLPALSRCVEEGGKLVLSGLLAVEQQRVEAALAEVRLETLAARWLCDGVGDHWVSLLIGRS